MMSTFVYRKIKVLRCAKKCIVVVINIVVIIISSRTSGSSSSSSRIDISYGCWWCALSSQVKKGLDLLFDFPSLQFVYLLPFCILTL